MTTIANPLTGQVLNANPNGDNQYVNPDGPSEDCVGEECSWKKPKRGSSISGDNTHTVKHKGKEYKVYFDRATGSWRSEELVSAPHGADFLGFSKGDVEERIKSGTYLKRLDKYKKPQ